MIVLQYLNEVVQVKLRGTPTMYLNLYCTYRRTMNGDLISYIRGVPNYHIDLDILLVSLSNREDFINLIKACNGKSFTYIDEDEDVWSVRLLTEPTEIINSTRYSNSVGVLLEGVKI